MGRSLTARVRHETDALLLRSVPYGEADAIVTLLTESHGVIAALGRGARRSKRRFAGLEPLHRLRVTIEERAGAELFSLVECAVAAPRLGLLEDLDAMQAAGLVMRWIRSIAPARTPDPDLWRIADDTLSRLDALPQDGSSLRSTLGRAGAAGIVAPGSRESSTRSALVGAGMEILSALGWGLELERCVACGRGCAPTAPAYAHAARGGLVCRACGGGPLLLGAELRRKLLEASSGTAVGFEPDEIEVAMRLVEDAMTAHTGASSTPSGRRRK